MVLDISVRAGRMFLDVGGGEFGEMVVVWGRKTVKTVLVVFWGVDV